MRERCRGDYDDASQSITNLWSGQVVRWGLSIDWLSRSGIPLVRKLTRGYIRMKNSQDRHACWNRVTWRTAAGQAADSPQRAFN